MVYGQITSSSYNHEVVNEVLSKGLWWKVGRGNSTLFWKHKWIGNMISKEAFPKLFLISNQERSLIIDMGYWKRGFSWMHDFLQSETEMYDRFFDILQ